VSSIFAPFRSVPGWTLDRFPWSAQRVFRYWELSEFRGDVAARFSDNRPAIITQTLGHGRTAMVVTPVSETADTERFWNNLTQSEVPWMWVMLAEGIGKHLASVGSQSSNYIIGEPVVLRPDLTPLPPSVLIGTPTPQETPWRITPDDGKIVIVTTTEPGNYTVRAGGAALHLGFSVNIPANATVLQRVDTSVLDRLFGADGYQVMRTPQEIVFGTARRRVGQEIYAAIMLLLACIFAVEYVFANRIYTSGGQQKT